MVRQPRPAQCRSVNVTTVLSRWGCGPVLTLAVKARWYQVGGAGVMTGVLPRRRPSSTCVHPWHARGGLAPPAREAAL